MYKCKHSRLCSSLMWGPFFTSPSKDENSKLTTFLNSDRLAMLLWRVNPKTTTTKKTFLNSGKQQVLDLMSKWLAAYMHFYLFKNDLTKKGWFNLKCRKNYWIKHNLIQTFCIKFNSIHEVCASISKSGSRLKTNLYEYGSKACLS